MPNTYKDALDVVASEHVKHKHEIAERWDGHQPTAEDDAKSVEFIKEFWDEKVQSIDDENVARIGGGHYRIGDEHAYERGFGGTIYFIKFNDGRLVRTSNLWSQGEIPEPLRPWLPDNAEFVTPMCEANNCGDWGYNFGNDGHVYCETCIKSYLSNE